MAAIDPLTAGAVLLATAATDAVYVMFTSAVVARKRVPAATWSSVWYLLSSFAVISYTENWAYVAFAAVGSWLGAFATITFLHRPPGGPPVSRAGSQFARSMHRRRAPAKTIHRAAQERENRVGLYFSIMWRGEALILNFQNLLHRRRPA
jgi:hypothetical protein